MVLAIATGANTERGIVQTTDGLLMVAGFGNPHKCSGARSSLGVLEGEPLVEVKPPPTMFTVWGVGRSRRITNYRFHPISAKGQIRD